MQKKAIQGALYSSICEIRIYWNWQLLLCLFQCKMFSVLVEIICFLSFGCDLENIFKCLVVPKISDNNGNWGEESGGSGNIFS